MITKRNVENAFISYVNHLRAYGITAPELDGYILQHGQNGSAWRILWRDSATGAESTGLFGGFLSYTRAGAFEAIQARLGVVSVLTRINETKEA